MLDLAQADPAGLGTARMLDAYHRRRHLDVVEVRVKGIDALNRASMIGGQALRDLRAAALNTLYSVGPVRKTLMRAGIGVR